MTAPDGGWSAALEASTRPGTVAVHARGGVREAALEHERAHASDLLPALSGLAEGAGVDRRALRAVAVGTGPGSFTGLRVATALGLSLARASGAHVIGVPSGEALAYRELAVDEEAVLLLDARGGELYFAHYRRTADDVVALREPCVLRPRDLADALPPDLPILGEPGVARAAALSEGDRSRVRTDAAPRASALLELALLRLERGGPHDPASVRPLYLRPFRTTRAS